MSTNITFDGLTLRGEIGDGFDRNGADAAAAVAGAPAEAAVDVRGERLARLTIVGGHARAEIDVGIAVDRDDEAFVREHAVVVCLTAVDIDLERLRCRIEAALYQQGEADATA